MRLLVTGPADWICDATVGSGGHAAAILKALGPEGRVIGLDQDLRALERARETLAGHSERVILKAANFRTLAEVVPPLAPGGLDGVLFDLGVSSEQIDTPESGFSYMAQGPLSMTMSGSGPDARDLVNGAAESELTRILGEYGDARAPRRLARAIVAARPLATTGDLAAAARRGGARTPADLARIFQAIRIAVNDEYGALRAGLEALQTVLKPGGRAVILSYHSGEDRIVKRFFSPVELGKPLPWAAAPVGGPRWELLTRGPIRPGEDEIRRNVRSRSARLRAARRV